MNQNPHAKLRPHPRAGFTLVELLVVIVIIAVLTAIGFPLANKIKATADRTKCLGQLKNWAAAIGGYAADNDGKYECNLVASVSYDVEYCTPYLEYWAPGIERSGDKYLASPSFDGAVKTHREMRTCPSVKTSETDYPVTILMVQPASGLVASNNRPARGKDFPLSKIGNPGRFMLMTETIREGNGLTTTPAQFESRVKPLTVKGSNFRHNGTVHTLMADFSVRSMTWSEIRRGLKYWNVP